MKNARIWIAFILAAILMFSIYPKRGKFVFEYQKGKPWMYENFIAPIDFPILKTQAEIQKEKASRADDEIRYYNYDETVDDEMISRFMRVAESQGCNPDFTRYVASSLADFYSQGIVNDFGEITADVIFVKKNKHFFETPTSEIYDLNNAYNLMVSDLVYKVREYAQGDTTANYEAMLDSLVRTVNLRSFFTANLSYDQKTSEMLHRDAVEFISPTKGTCYAGQLVVSKGELVTADIEQILDSYKAEYRSSIGFNGSRWNLYLSIAILVLLQLALLQICILFFDRAVALDFRKVLFMLLIALFDFAMICLFSHHDQRLFYVVPFALSALLLNAFFKPSFSLLIYIVSTIPLLYIPENGVVLFLINIAAGGIGLLSITRFNSGLSQFLTSIFIFLGMVLVYVAFNLASDSGELMWYQRDFVYLAINALLSVICFPFVFILERLFGFVSYSRLWELSDTNKNKLLKELAQKAPGTFQHSLQVANLAETATRAIGGDAMLARVGALYHDIGKTDNPMCFIENIGTDGVNEYHKNLTPAESARDLIHHVSEGVAKAHKVSLPDVVTDFISSHHGHTMTVFFYNKYCNGGGDPAQVEPFTYDGILPQTKEQAVLMIADSVEAASRTLKDYSAESISKLVDRIADDKMASNQFAEADISLKEFRQVKDSLKTQLQQIYHGRVVYPKNKTK